MSNFHHKPAIFVSEVHLKVQNLNRSLQFYKQIIGFHILEQTERSVRLTADGKTPLLFIEQPEYVTPKQQRTTGLYHFAILLPNRAELGKFLNHFIQSGYLLQGASDHLVSEALYLADPDGNGIEVYADRPASSWHWQNGEIVMATERLDAESVLAAAQGERWNGLPADTVMGHIHLHVAELEKAREFYCDGLGFDIVCRYGGQALFISSGGYHHHIGLNTWNGVGAPRPAEGSAGLAYYTVVYPSEAEMEAAGARIRQLGYQVKKENSVYLTKDPSGNRIRLVI